MGKFAPKKITEYTFVSLEEMVSSVVEEFDDGNDIDIVLPWEDVVKVMVALISTGKFTPYYVNFGHPEMDGYAYEYSISVNHLNNNALFVEPIYNTDEGRYNTFCNETTDILFASIDISKICYDQIISDDCSTVLFDIED